MVEISETWSPCFRRQESDNRDGAQQRMDQHRPTLSPTCVSAISMDRKASQGRRRSYARRCAPPRIGRHRRRSMKIISPKGEDSHQFPSLSSIPLISGVTITMLGLCFTVEFKAIAHPGGLDKYGCHNDRKNGGYHCHNGATPPPLIDGTLSPTPTTPPTSTLPNCAQPDAFKPPGPGCSGPACALSPFQAAQACPSPTPTIVPTPSRSLDTHTPSPTPAPQSSSPTPSPSPTTSPTLIEGDFLPLLKGSTWSYALFLQSQKVSKTQVGILVDVVQDVRTEADSKIGYISRRTTSELFNEISTSDIQFIVSTNQIYQLSPSGTKSVILELPVYDGRKFQIGSDDYQISFLPSFGISGRTFSRVLKVSQTNMTAGMKYVCYADGIGYVYYENQGTNSDGDWFILTRELQTYEK